jgi:transposase
MEYTRSKAMQINNLDHLGLVAGIMDELGLVELINKMLPQHKLQKVSSGQVVKAMILNSLGFISAPLYLFSEFFESKPVEHLLGQGIKADDLNDDCLGRTLDKLQKYGTTDCFLQVALVAVQKFAVKMDILHLDSTSISVEGQYLEPEGEEIAEPATIKITHGYSRDQRPDLKQFLINLICTADGGIPVWLKVGNGNDSDAQQFGQIAQAFRESWQAEGLQVADAAIFSETNLKLMGTFKWLTRVPQTISAAKSLIQGDTAELKPVACQNRDYAMWEVTQNYADIEQRWILIENRSRKEKEDAWKPRFDKIDKEAQKRLKAMCKKEFACKPDAMESLLELQQSLEWHKLDSVVVEQLVTKRTPGKAYYEKKPVTLGYRLKASLIPKENVSEQFSRQNSRFILATNHLDAQQWPGEKLLEEYKDQQKVERGFRFLKDPLFFASSVFVHKTERVEALALLMALTLLIYTLAERKLRQALAGKKETVLDQKKKPTSNPTLRWILQKFQGIHLIEINGIKEVDNISLEREKIIRLFGPQASHYYLLI